MAFYYYRFDPPRPTFMLDMSAAEAEVLKQHLAYWSGLVTAGKVIAFGPVADENDAAFGMGILELDDQEQAQTLADADPAMLSGLGFSIHISPMPHVIHRGRRAAS